MPVMYLEDRKPVARIVMDNGENRHNPAFVKEILALLDEIEADPNYRSVIIASSDPKKWSLGIDLNWFLAAAGHPDTHSEVRAFLHGLNDMFKRLATFPMPVIAAIGGHAFGDGAIMACACDFRLMRADKGYFCFPEVDLSIPFLPGMWAIVQKAIPYPLLEEMALSGRRLGAEELAVRHAITKACQNTEALDKESLEFAAGFAKSRGIFAEMKRRMNRPILDAIADEDPKYIDSLKLTV